MPLWWTAAPPPPPHTHITYTTVAKLAGCRLQPARDHSNPGSWNYLLICYYLQANLFYFIRKTLRKTWFFSLLLSEMCNTCSVAGVAHFWASTLKDNENWLLVLKNNVRKAFLGAREENSWTNLIYKNKIILHAIVSILHSRWYKENHSEMNRSNHLQN